MGPSITDWIMVGITAIYVVATIAIFIANIISANSAKNQLKESHDNLMSLVDWIACLFCSWKHSQERKVTV